jgi:hypothetical protein
MQVVNPTPAAVYSGIGNAIATISRVEGYASLWRGVSSVVVGAGMQEENDLLCIDKRGVSLMILQVRHMRFISQHTRWSSRQWVVTPLGITQ